MRRVIVDQIEALAELNRIVARHGRGVDASDMTRRGTRDEDAAIVAGRADAAASCARSRRENRAPPPPPPRQQPETRGAPPAPPPAATGAAAGSPISSPAPRATRMQPPARRCAPRSGRRATRSNRSNSISVDIARMIDHDAATELWDRYKRGERNVFTRRLYTLQGQQTFDEIRKRYRADREFKQTVDRYIAEFERLLDEVSRDDRGSVVARTYLTSETGKVYTMLAHAAGRFD